MHNSERFFSELNFWTLNVLVCCCRGNTEIIRIDIVLFPSHMNLTTDTILIFTSHYIFRIWTVIAKSTITDSMLDIFEGEFKNSWVNTWFVKILANTCWSKELRFKFQKYYHLYVLGPTYCLGRDLVWADWALSSFHAYIYSGAFSLLHYTKLASTVKYQLWFLYPVSFSFTYHMVNAIERNLVSLGINVLILSLSIRIFYHFIDTHAHRGKYRAKQILVHLSSHT